jgi:hypothetical protein
MRFVVGSPDDTLLDPGIFGTKHICIGISGTANLMCTAPMTAWFALVALNSLGDQEPKLD